MRRWPASSSAAKKEWQATDRLHQKREEINGMLQAVGLALPVLLFLSDPLTAERRGERSLSLTLRFQAGCILPCAVPSM